MSFCGSWIPVRRRPRNRETPEKPIPTSFFFNSNLLALALSPMFYFRRDSGPFFNPMATQVQPLEEQRIASSDINSLITTVLEVFCHSFLAGNENFPAFTKNSTEFAEVRSRKSGEKFSSHCLPENLFSIAAQGENSLRSRTVVGTKIWSFNTHRAIQRGTCRWNDAKKEDASPRHDKPDLVSGRSQKTILPKKWKTNQINPIPEIGTGHEIAIAAAAEATAEGRTATETTAATNKDREMGTAIVAIVAIVATIETKTGIGAETGNRKSSS